MSSPQQDCVFCAIIDEKAPATVIARWPEAIAIEPLDPVTDGHILVLPVEHVQDAAANPSITAATMFRAAQLMEHSVDAFNLITSAGRDATQTVMHLHIHIVPRHADDGLALPWTGQVATTSA